MPSNLKKRQFILKDIMFSSLEGAIETKASLLVITVTLSRVSHVLGPRFPKRKASEGFRTLE